jgi:hypothetical protein
MCLKPPIIVTRLTPAVILVAQAALAAIRRSVVRLVAAIRHGDGDGGRHRHRHF